MAAALRPVVDVGDAGALDEKHLEQNYVHQAPPADGHEPSVAEYLYYAEEQREKEAGLVAPITKGIGRLFATQKQKDAVELEKQHYNGADPMGDWDTTGLTEYQIELNNARRMLRVAGWGAVFYLITTDILGPFSAPYAISQMGLVPGITLYILFGLFGE